MLVLHEKYILYLLKKLPAIQSAAPSVDPRISTDHCKQDALKSVLTMKKIV